MIRILLVEDERGLALGLKRELAGQGYLVELAQDGQKALDLALDAAFDLILLDVGLPKKDGYTVCRELRQAQVRTPVIMLTAKGLEFEKIYGLDSGADDYVTKPFSSDELLARVRAQLRRTSDGSSEVYCFGDVEVNFPKAEIRRKGKPVEATALEFKLLAEFIQNRGRVLTREQLLNRVWKDSRPGDRVIDNHIMNLRSKIEPDPKRPIYLITRPGFGYLFEGN